MKHMAVAGTGTIGLMLGSLLAKAGEDVTIVSMFRRSMAELLNREGVVLQQRDTAERIPVRAVYIEDIPSDEQYDILFLTGRSNDTESILSRMAAHLRPDGIVTSLQNGLNDERIAAIVGPERTLPCVCFAGGQCPEPNYVVTHEGFFVLGELDGKHTERLAELAAILSGAKRVEISDDIIAERWKKLAEVSLTVPLATVTGYPLFSHYDEPEMQAAFAALAAEVWDARAKAGIRPYPLLGLTGEEWKRFARTKDASLSEKFLRASAKPRPAPDSESKLPRLAPLDAYTADIRKGRDLEIEYTNGYIIRKGESMGVPMEKQKKLVSMVWEIQKGSRKATPENLKELTQDNIII